jgi:hypothetical protein
MKPKPAPKQYRCQKCGHVDKMPPLRQPLFLTHDELLWVTSKVSDRYNDLTQFYARGRKGQRRLVSALTFLRRLQKKLWAI